VKSSSRICGFVGSTLAIGLAKQLPISEVIGFDQFHSLRARDETAGVARSWHEVRHADIRSAPYAGADRMGDRCCSSSQRPAGIDGRSNSARSSSNLGERSTCSNLPERTADYPVSTSPVYSIHR